VRRDKPLKLVHRQSYRRALEGALSPRENGEHAPPPPRAHSKVIAYKWRIKPSSSHTVRRQASERTPQHGSKGEFTNLQKATAISLAVSAYLPGLLQACQCFTVRPLDVFIYHLGLNTLNLEKNMLNLVQLRF
jgi:hypothetical protein